MERLSCDILVVGAGPAGSSAALAAAGRGLDVLVVERRDTIGVPVQCAEFVPALLLGEIDLVQNVVVQSVSRMHTILPRGGVRVTRSPGYMIRRDLFDQSLARVAQEKGARFLVATRAMHGREGEVLLRRKGEGIEKQVTAKVIVGADGPLSSVGRWIGSENRNLIPAVQWRVPLLNPMEHTEVHFDEAFYGGYGWLFPLGREANVGLGRKQRDEHDGRIGQVLERFVTRLAEQGKIGKEPLSTTAGWIPAEPVREVTWGNVLLVGDAAGHTHPITGAGVSQAVVGGQMAGKWAARAAETGDMSLLGSYEREWREVFAPVQQRAYGRRKALEDNWDRLEAAVRQSWIAFPEYYADP
jgi:geranylgeranyl reductase family protein